MLATFCPYPPTHNATAVAGAVSRCLPVPHTGSTSNLLSPALTSLTSSALPLLLQAAVQVQHHADAAGGGAADAAGGWAPGHCGS
jgi:hypothetical protein